MVVPSLPSLSLSPTSVLLDSGCTGHYLNVHGPCTNLQPALHPVTVYSPGGAVLTSTHVGLLPIPALPPAARICHIFPTLQSSSLFSLAHVCDHGCTAHFSANIVTVQYLDNSNITSNGDVANGLWHVQLPPPASTIPVPQPSLILSSRPSARLTVQPLVSPTVQPPALPTVQPRAIPPVQPSACPTIQPLASPPSQPPVKPPVPLPALPPHHHLINHLPNQPCP
jgi:hypothetical protein